ncbi:Nn.00g078980.m01.CDS01 [Neocucurbitaria sp. VM-36]
MDSLQQHDHLHRLPTELKLVVARYTHALTDRRSLSLVNKAWAEVVLPGLWETFTTDLLQRGQRDARGLAHPKSNIVKYVQNIHILGRSLQIGMEDHLPMLLAAIPGGQLRGFRSTGGVPITTFKLMLQLHPKLEELNISEHFSRLLECPWTATRLSNIRQVDVNVDGLSRCGFQKLWSRCTNLAHLRMTSPRVANGTHPVLSVDHFLSSEYGSTPKQTDCTGKLVHRVDALKLSSLHIGNVTLPKRLDTMFQRIDILALVELTIDGTFGVTELLAAAAFKFAESEPSLRKLRIVKLGLQATDEFFQSLLLLLLAFNGLLQLHIQCDDSNKVDVDGIVNHGETLKDLLIVNGGIHRIDKSKCMSVADFEKIALACPNIEQLCVNLYEITPDKLEDDVLGPHPSMLFEPTDFEQALGCLASLRHLKILRLTNPPNYRKLYFRPEELVRYFRRSLESGEQRYAFQARADGIMRYLGDRNSNIKLLVFSPVEELPRPENPDKNGHSWPSYYYYRGKMTDHRGTDIAVARPLADWKAHFPDATVLEGP